MILKDLIEKYSFDDIKPAFEVLWKTNSKESKALSSLSLKHLAILYQAYCAKPSIPSDYHIRLTSRWEGCTPSIDMNCVVFDKDENLQGPMAWHVAIGEILGMEINVDEDVRITERELIAGLYWELSYYNTEEKIELIRSHYFIT